MPEIFNQQTKSQPSSTADGKQVSSGGVLSMLMVRPQHVTFETQNEQEEIILLLRQHYIVNVGWIFATIVLGLIPTIVGPLLLTSKIVLTWMPSGYFIVLPLIWYLGVFGYALLNFLQWYFNVYIVTNERIVDVDWFNLLYKQLATTQLDKVQDVTFKQGGIADLFFNYGNVFIQTAGTEQNFEFVAVPHPDLVVREIDGLIEKREKAV